jgi:hypothetical protein
MTKCAQSCGLTLNLGNVLLSPNSLGMIHDSRTGLFALRPSYDRPINPAILHKSVQSRYASAVPSYRPNNWPPRTSAGAIAIGKLLVLNGQNKMEYWLSSLGVAAVSFILFLILFMNGKDSLPSRSAQIEDGKSSPRD